MTNSLGVRLAITRYFFLILGALISAALLARQGFGCQIDALAPAISAVGFQLGLRSHAIAAYLRHERAKELTWGGGFFFSLITIAPVFAIVPNQMKIAFLCIFSFQLTGYYAVGKVTCLFVGCCVASDQAYLGRFLPAFELVATLFALLGAFAFYVTNDAFVAFLILALSHLLIRCVSRLARTVSVRGMLAVETVGITVGICAMLVWRLK